MDPNQFWAHAAHESAPPSAPADQEATATAVPPGAPEAAGGPAVSPPTATTPQVPLEQEHGESNADFETRLREAEERAQRAEAEQQRLQGTFQQVQQGLERFASQQQQQQRQAEFERKRADIYERAQNMSPQEAFRYIQQEEGHLVQSIQEQMRQDLERAEREKYEVARRFAAPMFLDQLVSQHGLPKEARAELEALGDPDAAARFAPQLKARYDQINKLQDQINQLSRTQRAGALQSAGLGAVGGAVPSGGAPIQSSGDPDTDAMMVLAALRNGTYTASR